jgi:hypothetical protein
VSLCAIELNDAEVALRVGDATLREPALALFDGAGLRIGGEARKLARLQPALVRNGFWSQLGLDPLPEAVGSARTNADLAYEQLTALWQALDERPDDAILIVPASYSAAQLGLLAGIAEECGITVRGIVEGPLAATHRAFEGHTLAHLDLGLHDCALTLLDQGEGVSKGSHQVLHAHGWSRVEESLLTRLADAFVDQSRFDPRQVGASEQALYDALPGWLAAIDDSGRLECQVPARDQQYRATVSAEDVADAVTEVVGGITAIVARCAGREAALALQLGERAARVPGLAAALAAVEGVHVIELAPDAALVGALERRHAICSSDGGIALATRLPWLLETRTLEPAAPAAALPPSHVLVGDVAHAITAVPLVLGSDPGDAPRGVVLGASPGVAPRHVEIVAESSAVRVAPIGSSDVRIDGAPVREPTRVAAGDELQVGDASMPVRLIRVVDDGA